MATGANAAQLPQWEPAGPVERAVGLAALAAAPVLVVVHAVRLHASGDTSWVALVVVAAFALVCADFLTGLVHWSADTWGSEAWPVIGPRLLRPFRLHHINPDDLLRRDFIDCNGDVAVLASLALALTFLVPLDPATGRLAALFLVALAVWVLPTNQVHQWAHHPDPGDVIRWAQDRGLMLDHARHAVHHVAPFDTQYCILTGWCNRPLAAAGFFPALERGVAALTGLVPRGDEQSVVRQRTVPSPAGDR